MQGNVALLFQILDHRVCSLLAKRLVDCGFPGRVGKPGNFDHVTLLIQCLLRQLIQILFSLRAQGCAV